MSTRSRSGWRRWCLLLAATAAAALLGAGVSQAQTGCPPEGCLRVAVRSDTSTPPSSSYPQPQVAYMQLKGQLMELQVTPSFAYDPTTRTVGWYSSALSSTTWPTTSAASALVLQSAQTSTLRGGAATTSSAVTVCPPDANNTPMPVTGLLRDASHYGYTSGIRIMCSGQAEIFPGVLSTVITSPFKGIGGLSPAGPQQPLTTSCAVGAVGFGFSVGAGEVMDNVSLEC